MTFVLISCAFLVAPLHLLAQNVGIGTSTPVKKLHVEGNAYISDGAGIGVLNTKAGLDIGMNALFRGTNSNAAPEIINSAVEFFFGRTNIGGMAPGTGKSDLAFNYASAGGGYRHFISTRHDANSFSPGNSIHFYINNTGDSAGSSAPGIGNLLQLSVAGSGVGIGKMYPTSMLHVAGNQKIDSTYTLEFGAGMAGKENNAGKIGYQAFSPDALDIIGAGPSGLRKLKFWNEAGAVFIGPVLAPAFTISSDARYKKDIRPLANATAMLAQLRGVAYYFDREKFPGNGFPGQLQFGYIAQEVENTMPQLVSTGSDGYKSVNYLQLVPLLTEAMKEQQQQINRLMHAVEYLQQQVSVLRNRE